MYDLTRQVRRGSRREGKQREHGIMRRAGRVFWAGGVSMCGGRLNVETENGAANGNDERGGGGGAPAAAPPDRALAMRAAARNAKGARHSLAPPPQNTDRQEEEAAAARRPWGVAEQKGVCQRGRERRVMSWGDVERTQVFVGLPVLGLEKAKPSKPQKKKEGAGIRHKSTGVVA